MLLKMNLFAALLSYGVTSAVLSNCGTSNDLAVVNNYGLNPDNPVANQNFSLWIDYTLNTDVQGGLAMYEANMNGLPYYEEHDLCTQTTCPILIGRYNETSKPATFPDFVGRLITTITWQNENGKQIFCVKGTFKV